MTGEEFRAIVARLGFASSGKANDEGLSAAARFFGADPRSARRWLHTGPPRPVAIALRLMLAGKWDAAQAEAIVREAHVPRVPLARRGPGASPRGR